MSSIQVEEEIYDVLVIGAGPCGLAISARLHEHTPAALFTDEEHRRFHWISKYGNKMPLKHVRSGKISPPKHAAKPQYKMLVLDADSDTWMGRWNRLFKMYDISHLRSPMLWHVDPLDRDALLAHAYANDRADELVEIRNCVGKEVSKHGRKKSGQRACGRRQEARVDINVRERNDYYNPSTSLFCDHCEKVAARYNLSSNIIRKEALQHLDYDEVKGISIDGEKLFTVTSNKVRRYARTVVLAVGPANVAKIPHIPSMPDEKLPQTCHSMHITEFPDPIVKARIAAKRTTNILVVGGGLTSAQLTDLAIRKGVTKVWHVMRGPLRIKHFDVGLEWMGKFKNAKQAQFYYADSDDERIEMIKEARGGGSITPVFHKRLKKHLLTKKLELFTETSLVDAQFDAENGTWSVQTKPPIDMPAMDYMYFATGIQTDFSSLPYLQTILEKYPIEGRGGFPCINNDLMWNDDVPLFMMGRLAALRLGPAAPNLGGAQVGAERIAWAIEDRVARPGEDEAEDYRKGTGCKTCKARKVKCDETWPRCKRCLTTGRTCTGYIAPPPGSFSWTSLLRTKPQTLPITNTKEVRSLSFFHHVVAPVLSGPFDGSFWTYFVVQMAQSEPAARHAVLAISSLFESFEPAKESVADEFAIMHYNKAISILTRGTKPCVDTVLLVCTLFICIEFLRGNHEAAITHASHGVQLLNSAGHESRLSNIFAQMSVFPLFFMDVGTEFPLLQGDEGADLKNPVFYTISEAQHALEHLSIRIITLVRDGNSYRLDMIDEAPQEWMLDEQEEARQDLEAWGVAFERFRGGRPFGEREDSATLALITRHRLMKVWIENCFRRGEMGYDGSKEEFITIVDCARKAAENLEVQHTTPGKFMFNVGFNPMLHFAVWKCRYLSLRVEALSLMRRLSSQQESLWDAALMYNVSRRIIEVEHGIDLAGDYDLYDERLPTDENRIRGFFFREGPEAESVMWDKNAETVYFLMGHPEGGVVFRKEYVRNKNLVLDSGQTFWM
ncbi:Aspercryptin biosynthesis cluster-specific transcription regulator atnN [Fusarium oxysporum f. sp. rapae]|uniref:Aspercryptin biosynthesis cluster-specific transcription regulator atnN n=1 Tax=Fusarium oxysporum f. sp. rapae TaxID=485398 RepID=A0A8J5NZS6_FUSOX|nr:Aspercryptin biosynthesis cluster-specific transcription regulator atnN [Fusarium oxysporum f. sp. rapae]